MNAREEIITGRTKEQCKSLFWVRNHKPSTAVSVERASYHTRHENQTIGYASDAVEIKILGQCQRQERGIHKPFWNDPAATLILFVTDYISSYH